MSSPYYNECVSDYEDSREAYEEQEPYMTYDEEMAAFEDSDNYILEDEYADDVYINDKWYAFIFEIKITM